MFTEMMESKYNTIQLRSITKYYPFLPQLDDLLRETTDVLSSLAMFVNIAKNADKQNEGAVKKITSDITHIEDTVIYHMLCNLNQIHSQR